MGYLFMRFPEGKEKAVTFSYDDGHPPDIRLADTLSNAGIKCTFNLNCMNDAELTDKEINEHFFNNGHEVAVHGDNHKANGIISTSEGIQEVLNCRLKLEKRFDRIIRGMAYPDSGINTLLNGTTYDMIKNYLAELGIVYARTAGNDNTFFLLPNDWYAWMPTAHHRNPKILNIIDEFINIDYSKLYRAAKYPRLCFIWGHSVEFDRDNNWGLLDEICNKIGGRTDIWYATNTEIYDYVTAFNSLIFSADRKKVYNPSLYTIWFSFFDKTIKINPGETIHI